ncbi:EH domain binding protein epsin 2 [Talaromyces stipitatus ATCC 10500]|uniref:EH domain binding protein epsin 2 n=1 Tax=Talaromyces stipitatus (strain ATCC 10500 / CBS 375.48 / QM 6759 / NRRL 1006) TaxID=441959 RepID=B8MAM9_TALSN|nr:EH domain binding protein epsin 2 [Talaromyces stipitatus ATCC 10500]EED17453.1 EH domain binding protein epsin 2 [Talaromyces stipitatus ATCC 10500]
MSRALRSVRNVTKGYSSVQVKVRNATSNDPWGPTGTEMGEIAALTFNNDFYEIVDMLDKRLNDKGKNWRHVLKSLKVLDYCLHEGSELVVTWARKNVYIIKTLREFQYIDDEGRDVGQNVRVSAKELTALILDEDRLRSERSDRKLWKSRVSGIDEGMQGYGGSSGGRRPDREKRERRNRDEDDTEYQLAIEASKAEAEEERKRRERAVRDEDDDDLARAIKLSKEEEELRRRELEESNAKSLFDDTPVQPAQAQPTGYNQGYQQQPAVDWFGNPLDAQQPLTTGYLNNQYAQPNGYQATGQMNAFSNGFQVQPTGFDPSQQFGQPQNNFFQNQSLQPQQTAFNNNNPYGTNPMYGQVQQSPQENYLQPGSHNPWATDKQQGLDALRPMPTGSNNPFASAINRPVSQPSRPGPPSLNTLAEERATTSFNTTPSGPNPIANYKAPNPLQPSATSTKPTRANDDQYARLNALLASGEGQDTFGNVGELRVPAHHTAPGTFINSAGQGFDRLNVQQTGSNPFFNQQFTGMPQQTGFAQSNNPFGAPGHQQQQQGGSLIDL